MPPRRLAPVDANAWSRQSKQSEEFRSPPDHYEDIEYTCSFCGSHATFTAEAQKRSFEVAKNYIWQRRTLCSPCMTERVTLEDRESKLAQQWLDIRAAMERDTSTLADWLRILELLPRYGVRRNSARIAMLGKLLHREA